MNNAQRRRFFALDPWREISGEAEIASQAWDIAIDNTDGVWRQIWTNSGSTAEEFETGGQGGVYHTNRFTLVGTTASDRVQNHPGSLNVDSIRRILPPAMGPVLPAEQEQTINVMNHRGWATGDGIDTPFATIQDNSTAFFVGGGGGMPPIFPMTGRVFIIRTGDGLRYIPIQVSGHNTWPMGPGPNGVLEIYVLEIGGALTP